MKKEIKYEISSCRECCYSINSSKLHNDPFTSSPVDVYWYCIEKLDFGYYKNIDNEYTIPEWCPL